MNTNEATEGAPVIFGQSEAATYREQVIPAYRGNPLLEALPALITREQAAEQLGYRPPYDPQQRTAPNEIRLHLLLSAIKFFVALPMHLDLHERLSLLIRSGYQSRNPLAYRFYPHVQDQVQSLRNGTPTFWRPTQTTILSSLIAGISGIGKTTAVERVLSFYPQIIVHHTYQERPWNHVQVVWLKLECPHDGSVRSLCLNFFHALDLRLGTQYYPIYTRRGRATAEQMLPDMARLAALHSLGVLLIDEIQHLSAAKSGGAEKMLNFFVQLINTIGLPVVLIGTYKALALLASEFRQARRTTGLGDLIWDRLPRGAVWELFVAALWRYQYVQLATPLTPALNTCLYEACQGIIDLAIKIYLVAQFRAIRTGLERITPGLIRSVVKDEFQVVQPFLSALRTGNTRALAAFDDVIMRVDPQMYLQADGALHGGRQVDAPLSSVLSPAEQAHTAGGAQPQADLSGPAEAQQTDASPGTVIPPQAEPPLERPVSVLGALVRAAQGRGPGPHATLAEAGYLRPASEFFATGEAVC